MEEDSPIFDNDVLDVYVTIPPEYRQKKWGFMRSAMMILSPELSDIPQESTRLPPSASPRMWEFGTWLYKQQMELFQKLRLDSPYKEEMKEYIQSFRFGYGQAGDWFKESDDGSAHIKENQQHRHLEKRNIINMHMVRDITHEYLDSPLVESNISKKVRLMAVLLSVEVWFRFFVDEDFSLARKWGGYQEFMEA